MHHTTLRFHLFAWGRLSVTAALLSTAGAQAETSLERRIAQAASPHQSLDQGGPRQAVHWARMMERLGDNALNQEALEEMRDSVRDCVRRNQEYGLPIKQVAEWSSWGYRNRRDSYVGREASISYSHSSTYLANPEDCSLMEGEHRNATLSWSSGLCSINLDDKTTSGDCPESLASLPQPAKLGQRSVQGIPKTAPGMPANPMLPRLTGEVRTVAGQPCDVVTNPTDPDRGTVCYAQAVGFAGYGPAPSPRGTPLLIEARSRRGFVYEADAVRMNFGVLPAVFVPHLQGGFSARPLQGDKK